MHYWLWLLFSSLQDVSIEYRQLRLHGETDLKLRNISQHHTTAWLVKKKDQILWYVIKKGQFMYRAESDAEGKGIDIKEAGLCLAEPGTLITPDIGAFCYKHPLYQNTRISKYTISMR